MRVLSLIAAFLLSTLVSSAVRAQEAEAEPERERRYGTFYNGAFVDFSARAALKRSVTSDYNAWAFDVGLRQALVMHLLDTRIAYEQDRFSPRSPAVTGQFTVHSVGITGAFHPLYMALLLSDWFGYVIASWYIEAGLAGQYGRFNGGEEDDFGLRLSLGTGLDIPITDPDRGWSIWLNTLYRFTWSDFDLDSGGEVNLHHHAGWAGLSLRFNGLLF